MLLLKFTHHHNTTWINGGCQPASINAPPTPVGGSPSIPKPFLHLLDSHNARLSSFSPQLVQKSAPVFLAGNKRDTLVGRKKKKNVSATSG